MATKTRRESSLLFFDWSHISRWDCELASRRLQSPALRAPLAAEARLTSADVK